MGTNIMKKYIVIDTWNGEGYSYQNGTEIKRFESKVSAERYAEAEATKQLPYPISERFDSEKVVRWIDNEITKIGYSINEEYGTYQVHPLPEDAYAVMIKTNVNEVVILTEEQYKNKIEWLLSEFEENYESSEEEEYFQYEDNGDLFVACFDSQDYDYQFRLIKNNQNL